MYQTTVFYFALTVWLAMAGMLIRKGMKMTVGKNGMELSDSVPAEIKEKENENV
jgi:RNA:NAD 2'-phosphotransferase (TPT1/KptA family)